MLTATKTHLSKHWASTILMVAVPLSAVSLKAEVNNIRDALGVAMQHEAIASEAEKMRLYSLSAHYNGINKRWNFQFFSAGENLHHVTVTNSGTAFHSLRSRQNIDIFNHVDFAALPAPEDVLLDDLVTKGKTTIESLDFKPANNDKLYIRYQLRNDFRNKQTSYHSWSVTIPVGDGKKGKTVTLKNGQVDTITNAILSGN